MPPSLPTYARVFLARCIALLGPLGTAVISARMLGPEDRGRYYYVLTLVTIGVQIASLGLSSSNTFLVSRQPELLPRILANALWIALSAGLSGALGVVLFDRMLGDSMGVQSSAGYVLALCPLTLLFLYLSNLAVGTNRSPLFNRLILFNSAALLATTLAAALWEPRLDLFLAALLVTGIASCVLAWVLVAQGAGVSWRFDTALFARSIAFALRAHVIILIGFLMGRTAPLILREAEAFADLGQWSIAAQIGDALLLLPSTVSLLLYPALLQAEADKRWKELTTTLLRVGVVMAIVCCVSGLLAAPAIELVFGSAYAPAVAIMLAMLPGILLLSAASVISQFLTAIGIPAVQIVAWIVSWGIHILLSIVMFRAYGVVGLASAQSVSAAVVCLWLWAAALHRSPRVSDAPTARGGARG